MRVYVFSLPKNLARAKKIHDFLELKGHSAKLFDSDSRFFNCVYKKEDLPDFIVYDYFLFNHNLFNIYTFMKGECCLIPLLFFNDPTPHSGITEFFFKNLLNSIHSEKKLDWKKYGKIVSELAEAVNLSKNTVPSINRLPETAPTETKLKEQKAETKENPLHITRKLSGTNLTIFKKLFNNLNSCVPLEELQHSEELDKNLKETTIFCTISKIRKTLKAVDEDSFEILKNSNGYTMISRY